MRKCGIICPLIMLIVVFLFSCNSKKQDRSPVTLEAALIEVNIEGMTCTGCEQTIQKRVGDLEGIVSVKASYTEGRAVVEYLPDKVDTTKMKDAISGAGYTVKNFIKSGD